MTTNSLKSISYPLMSSIKCERAQLGYIYIMYHISITEQKERLKVEVELRHIKENSSSKPKIRSNNIF